MNIPRVNWALTSNYIGTLNGGHALTSPETVATWPFSPELGARRCALYTQLTNPRSNAIYRRLGYDPVAEYVRYELG